MLILLIGCSSEVDEKQIQEDLETDSQFDFLKDGEKIEKLATEKRQTEKDKNIDTIWCMITMSDTEVSYQKDVVLTYGLYDKGGWILDDVFVNTIAKTPLKGIAEEKIASSLKGQLVTIDDERWDIAESNIASGKLEINYKFDDEWEIDTISEIEEFKATIKPEKALDVTEDNLIDELNEFQFGYGESKSSSGTGINFTNYNSQQTITIHTNEISNFVIESQTASSKGGCQEFECGFTLTKQLVVFDIQAQFRYLYDSNSGWCLDNVTILPEVASVSIEGTWMGNYVVAGDNGEVELNITSTDEAGNITGVYSWTSSK